MSNQDINFTNNNNYTCNSDNFESWTSLINTDIENTNNKLLKSQTDLSNSYEKDKNKENKESTNISISEIISFDPKDIELKKLLKYEITILSHLKNYFKNCFEKNIKPDLNLHIPKLEWVLMSQEHLRKKLKLPEIKHKNNNNNIPRSSYKFCAYGHKCEFNYFKNKNSRHQGNGCYAQHFVHNYLCADIKAICDYLYYINNNNSTPNYDELLKCITTVHFVVIHMCEELESLSNYYPNILLDKLHCEKSVKNKSK